MKSFANMFALCGALMIFLTLSSCVKEGQTGPQGPSGQNGIVNVSTYSLTVNLADFLVSSSNDEYYIHQDVSSADIQPTDAVLVYYDRETYNSTQYWAQLPFDDYYSSTLYNHFSYELGYDGYMFINIRNSDANPPYSPMTGNLYFKIIVIKGYSSKKATIPSTLNTKNYEEVIQFYNIH